MTTIPYRLRVAAQVIARDHAHLLGPVRPTVRLRATVVEGLLRMADRARYDGFNPTSYDLAPLAFHALSTHTQRAISGMTRNKRLNALLSLALHSGRTISFEAPPTRVSTGSITVDVEAAELADLPPIARERAAEWLRVEYADALQTLVNRAGRHLGPGLRAELDPGELPDDPAARIETLLEACARLGRIVRDALGDETADASPSARPSVRVTPIAPHHTRVDEKGAPYVIHGFDVAIDDGDGDVAVVSVTRCRDQVTIARRNGDGGAWFDAAAIDQVIEALARLRGA